MNEFQDESNESLEPQADPMPEAGENISQDSQESQDSQQDTQESAPEVSGSDTVESAELLNRKTSPPSKSKQHLANSLKRLTAKSKKKRKPSLKPSQTTALKMLKKQLKQKL